MRRFLGAVLAWGMAVTAAGCNCAGGAGPPPCESPDPPAGCGVPCADAGTAACDVGFFCGADGKCTAECELGSDVSRCADDEVCSTEGRCIPMEDGRDATTCADVTLMTNPTTPTVLLLIDQSGSMDDPFDTGTRWSVMRSVLTDPATGLIYTLESVVRFGLALYTGDVGMCPELIQVPPALNNAMAIDTVYQGENPLSETPTGESIDAVVPGLVAFAEPGPKIIILATDGEPDTCAVPNPQMGQPEAVAAAMNAHAMGIDLYMIGVGLGSVSMAHMQDMANAGVGLPVGGAVNAAYYEVGTQAALVAALSAIVGGVISCTLDLNGMIDPSMAGTGSVTIDGMTIQFGDPDGWDVVDSDTIILQGAACTTLGDGSPHTVEATFPCGVIL